jgi:hypothetical protein
MAAMGREGETTNKACLTGCKTKGAMDLLKDSRTKRDPNSKQTESEKSPRCTQMLVARAIQHNEVPIYPRVNQEEMKCSKDKTRTADNGVARAYRLYAKHKTKERT